MTSPPYVNANSLLRHGKTRSELEPPHDTHRYRIEYKHDQNEIAKELCRCRYRSSPPFDGDAGLGGGCNRQDRKLYFRTAGIEGESGHHAPGPTRTTCRTRWCRPTTSGPRCSIPKARTRSPSPHRLLINTFVHCIHI